MNPKASGSGPSGRRHTGARQAVGEKASGSGPSTRRHTGARQAVGEKASGSGPSARRVSTRPPGGTAPRTGPQRRVRRPTGSGERVRTGPTAEATPPTDAPVANTPDSAGPRGIADLQAEMAQDDVRLLARQIAKDEHGGAKASRYERSGGPGPLVKNRHIIAPVIVVAALLWALLPVLGEYRKRSAQQQLASAVQQAARTVGSAPGAADVPTWIRERDLPALKTFYTAQRPAIVQTIQQAGFDELEASAVSIRVDYDDATLIIGAQIASSDDAGLSAMAALDGQLVGRAPPAGGFGVAFSAHSGPFLVTMLVGGLLAGGLWIVPVVTARRRKA